MGICETRKNEICDKSLPVPLKDANITKKAICKIKYTSNSGEIKGTGFFIIYENYYYLITNYHIIPDNIKNIEIETWEEQIYKLDLNNRNMKYLKDFKDITAIQISPTEIKGIKGLNFDLNYISGYSQYIKNNVFSIGYPNAEEIASGGGKIDKILNNCEFYHTIPTKYGSSGSPIILFNTLKVIGVHKAADHQKKLNIGTFIGEIIKELNKDKTYSQQGNQFISDNKNNENIIPENISERNNNTNDLYPNENHFSPRRRRRNSDNSSDTIDFLPNTSNNLENSIHTINSGPLLNSFTRDYWLRFGRDNSLLRLLNDSYKLDYYNNDNSYPLVDKDSFKNEELEDVDFIDNLNTRKVLEIKIKEIIEKIKMKEGKTPIELVQKKINMMNKKQTLEKGFEDGTITPKEYIDLMKKSLEHDQLLAIYMKQNNEYEKMNIVIERIELIKQEMAEIKQFIEHE